MSHCKRYYGSVFMTNSLSRCGRIPKNRSCPNYIGLLICDGGDNHPVNSVQPFIGQI